MDVVSVGAIDVFACKVPVLVEVWVKVRVVLVVLVV